MLTTKTTLIAALAAAALLLTGCGPSDHEQKAAAFSEAFDRCVWAHPDIDTYAAEDGDGEVLQTAGQSCRRWLDNVGETVFIDTWDQEYAETYKATLG